MHAITMRSILVACLVSVAAVVSTAAQERAWFFDYGSPAQSALLSEVTVEGGGRVWAPIRRIALPYHRPFSTIVLAGGGRFLVWTAAPATSRTSDNVLVWLETRTGQLHIFPNHVFHSGVALAVDRRSGRIVARDVAAFYVIDLNEPPTITTIPFPTGVTAQGFLAVARGRIFAGDDYSPTANPHISVLDVDTGALIGRLDGVSSGEFTRDESRFLGTIYRSSNTTHIAAYDTETLGLVAEGDLPIGVADLSTVINGTLLGTSFITNHDFMVRAYDANTLAFLAEKAVSDQRTDSGVRVSFASGFGGSSLYMRLDNSDNILGCLESRMEVVDTKTANAIAHIRLSSLGIEPCSWLSSLGRPESPRNLRSNISGRSVTLTWDPPPDIGDYEIEAGSAPGLRNIGVFRTGGKSFATFADVPAGTYYVRVRAINELGVNDSAEISVIVP
jgi:hypothetical protein